MDTAGSPLKVFVVDDHPVMRQGIGVLLQQAGVEVVGSAATVADALAGISSTAPHVALVDLGLGREDGRALLRKLGKDPGGPKRLVYSMNEDAGSVEESLAAGASGYVTKGEVWETLVAALRAVAAGECYLSPRASRALDALPRVPSEAAAVALSVREREVFRLLGEGYSTKEVGARLEVSPRTVESYCARLQEKMGLSGMRELRRQAIGARKG
ncbi:MAG TPA: response regulator transcription factor [Myxococcales bacterium]|jgi:DNA-binding NarL/FixJ family response regulator